jgi:hypothetical protein
MKYTITDSKISIDKNTGQQYVDGYGNLSWSVMANDEKGQVYSFLKRTKAGNQPPKIGDVLEGTMSLETSKNGNTYNKFTADKKDFSGGFGGKSFSDPNTMLIAYAKDVIVALINNAEKGKITTDNIKDDLTTLTYHFKALYDELKVEKPQTPTETPKAPQTPPQSQPDQEDNEIDVNEIPF